jgi:hypothetical protein
MHNPTSSAIHIHWKKTQTKGNIMVSINNVSNAFSAITGFSGGDVLQQALENKGVNESGAARAGALYDLSTGNLVGYHQNMVESLTGYEPQDRPKFNSPGCGKPHCPPNPRHAIGRHVQRMDLANQQHGLMGALGGAAAGFALGGPHGALAGGALGLFAQKAGARCKAKALEHRLENNPLFRRRFEAKVGGRYIPDGRCDGKITIAKNGMRPHIPGLTPGAFPGLLGQGSGSVLSGLQRGFASMQNLINGFQGAGQANGSNNPQGYGAQGSGAVDGESKIRAQAEPGSEVSKLPNPCTFEDLVAAFLIDVVKDMEKELEEKMGEYEKMKGSDESGDSKSGAAGGGAGLGQIGSVVGGMAGSAVGSMVAPGIGTMVGGNIGSAVGGAVGKQAGSAVGGSSSSSGAAEGAEGSDEDSRQIMFEKIKDLMQKLQQALQSLSNVLNTMHQGSMNAIRNIRA